MDLNFSYSLGLRSSFSARSQSWLSWPGSRPRLSYNSYARSLILLSEGTASGVISDLPGEVCERTTTGAFDCLIALVRLTKPHFSSNLWNGWEHPYGRELSNGHRTLA